MTAIVAVLNKHGIAIAADSAATMGNKVVYNANKIFTLSKYQPVGIATYSNASFMGVPWDIIIKEYRRNLDRKSYGTLYEYVDNFEQYLRSKKFFVNQQIEKRHLLERLELFYNSCREEICNDKGINATQITDALLEQKFTTCNNSNKKAIKCHDLKLYSIGRFSSFFGKEIIEFCKGKFNNPSLMQETFYYYLTAESLTGDYTGLVFFGYGTNDLFPKLYSMQLSIGFDEHIKDSKHEETIIDHSTIASICPYAQTDVSLTILRGINPTFNDIVRNAYKSGFHEFQDAMVTLVRKSGDNNLADGIQKLDIDPASDKAFHQMSNDITTRYTNPLLQTVAHLDKEDMANIAESLISLTSLVRRMSPDKETVGGPVDVAFVSKGDGFIWVKRKHYFKPELNIPFFMNYLK